MLGVPPPMTLRLALTFALVLSLAGCPGPVTVEDDAGTTDTAVPSDAPRVDAMPDAGVRIDGGGTDAGTDGGEVDANEADAGSDAPGEDAGSDPGDAPDPVAPDAPTFDAGNDGGVPDAGCAGRMEIPGDGIDSDCDGREHCYEDRDDDGFRTDGWFTSTNLACDGPFEAPASFPSGDCADRVAAVHPGALEVCSGYDDDCDGTALAGEGDEGDGYVTCTGFVDQTSTDAFLGTGDCDTNDPTRFQLLSLRADRDFDGAGTGPATPVCSGETSPAGWSSLDIDCDDGDPFRYLGAPEIVSDGIDQNCAGDGDLIPDDTNAVFVNGACASPCGAGTRASPVTTIAGGITLAGTTRVVVVAEGTYDEELVTRTSLFGGYSADFSVRDPAAHVTRIQRTNSVPVRVTGGHVAIQGFTIVYSGTMNGVALYANGGTFNALDDVIEATGLGTVRALFPTPPFHGARLVVRATVTTTSQDAYGIDVLAPGHFYLEDSTVEVFVTNNGHSTTINAPVAGTVGVVRGSTLHGAAAPIGSSTYLRGRVIEWGPDVGRATASSLYLEDNDIRAGSRSRSTALGLQRTRLISVRDRIAGDAGFDESVAIRFPGLGHATIVGDLLVTSTAHTLSGTSAGIIAPSHGLYLYDTIVAGAAARSQGVIGGSIVHGVFVDDVIVVGSGLSVLGMDLFGMEGTVTLASVDFYGPPASFDGILQSTGGPLSSASTVDACLWAGCAAASGTTIVAPAFVGGTPSDHHLTVALPGVDPAPYYVGALDDVDLDGHTRPGTDGVYERGADERP